MEDILASIRRILAEEEGAPPATPVVATSLDDGVLQLDASMMLTDPVALPEASSSAAPLPITPPPLAAPTQATPVAAAPVSAAPVSAAPAPIPLAALQGATLMAPEAAAATATSVGSLVRTLAAERATQVYGGGPTIEDLVRAELRPLLKEWLDANLPTMVERLVRAEIERVVGRAVP
jgi:uncharacterized protein